ncbi:metallophosphoesterase family protein [Lysinibacillus piscis]|uniref:Calcineurin-like phosphoesterase domain-containing protein n=1 Tax=Lysinibacillus piscis TaxID=2518931 RepID=A0ABQ5NH38_9BACI|nr:metallophosphoesterase [Lysinibacillus sp. KH24]GLC87647.1 hypothetical protein LYSBPC_07740 [Lysinibacillus sp. KH24]
MTNHAATLKNNTDFFYDNERFTTDERPWLGTLPEFTGKDFRFVVLGDRCGIALPGIFEKALELTKQLNPNFVLSVGDLIEGYWSQEEEAHAEWEQMESLLQEMELPFFFTVGNHDYGNELMVKVWRARRGFEYYAFRYANHLFLVANSEETLKTMSAQDEEGFRGIAKLAQANPEKAVDIVRSAYRNLEDDSEFNHTANPNLLRADLSEEQLSFFEKVLEENKDVHWTFLTIHTPAWRGDSPQFKQLENLLSTRKHTIFAGHLHQLELHEKEGGNRIQMGRTGSIPHGEGKHDLNHIMLVSAKEGHEPSFTVIDLDGVYAIEHFRKNSNN